MKQKDFSSFNTFFLPYVFSHTTLHHKINTNGIFKHLKKEIFYASWSHQVEILMSKKGAERVNYVRQCFIFTSSNIMQKGFELWNLTQIAIINELNSQFYKTQMFISLWNLKDILYFWNINKNKIKKVEIQLSLQIAFISWEFWVLRMMKNVCLGNWKSWIIILK